MKKVYFYTTCLGTAVIQRTILNAIEFLRREGVEVIFKGNQTCCLQSSFNSGYLKGNKRTALCNMGLFEKDYPIVVPNGSYASMMNHDYLELFKEDSEFERVEEFSSRVTEPFQYLDEVLKAEYGDKKDPVRVIWRSDYHTSYIQKSIETSRNLIKRLKNVKLVNLEYEEECCGLGGVLVVKESEISNAMTRARVRDIQNTGARCLISNDGGCLLSVGGTMHKIGLDVRGLHLYDFLLKGLEGIRL